MRRSLRIFGGAGITLCLALSGGLIAVQVTHPRDESSYASYLLTYGGVAQAPGGTVPPRAALIAEGDRACAWLGGRTWALWRTDPSLRVLTLEARYVAQVRHVPLAWSGQPDHGTIAAAAWNYLCPAALELREPHDIFGTTSQD